MRYLLSVSCETNFSYKACDPVILTFERQGSKRVWYFKGKRERKRERERTKHAVIETDIRSILRGRQILCTHEKDAARQ